MRACVEGRYRADGQVTLAAALLIVLWYTENREGYCQDHKVI